MPNGDGSLYTTLMALPGASQALTFLQQEAASFTYVPVRLDNIRTGLESVRDRATARGDSATAAQASAALSGLSRLQSLYAQTSGDVSRVMTAVNTGQAGISIVPRLLGVATHAAAVLYALE